MRTLHLAIVTTLLFLVGCGDDSGTNLVDGGSDSGGDGGGDSALDQCAADAAVDAGDPVPADVCLEEDAMCDFVAQTGCSDGFGCYFANDGTILGAVCAQPGEGSDGDTCGRIEDCEGGFYCAGLMGEGTMGVCRRLCCVGATDAGCPADQQCVVEFVNMETEERTGVGHCVPLDDCDPLTHEGCDEGEGCYLQGDEGRVRCGASTMNKGAGESCALVNDCSPGFDCVSIGDDETFQCRRLCEVGSRDDGCEGGESCRRLRNCGFPKLGICAPDE
jgi:hypothetical protein